MELIDKFTKLASGLTETITNSTGDTGVNSWVDEQRKKLLDEIQERIAQEREKFAQQLNLIINKLIVAIILAALLIFIGFILQ